MFNDKSTAALFLTALATLDAARYACYPGLWENIFKGFLR